MRTRLGLKVLGLSALVLGVMAIGTAGVAQAEEGACWGIINAAGKLECLSNILEAKTKIEFENKTGTLLIANKNIEILCTGANFVEGGELAANGSILPGKLQFEGCVSRTNDAKLELLNVCKPVDPVGGSGTIRTEKGDGLIVLHKLKTDEKLDQVVLLLPEKGTILAKIHTGELCSFGEEIIVEGHLVLTDCKGLFSTHEVTHLVEEFKALQLMHVGANLATIHGSANISLAGTHAGFKWAGLAK